MGGTGYYASHAHNSRSLVHWFPEEGRAICGYRPAVGMAFQFCASTIWREAISCPKCQRKVDAKGDSEKIDRAIESALGRHGKAFGPKATARLRKVLRQAVGIAAEPQNFTEEARAAWIERQVVAFRRAVREDRS